MIEKDKKYIWHPYTSLAGTDDNIFIESAKGIYLYTPEGRKILDAISSWWVNLHGHSNPYIANAIAEQAKKLEHVIFAGFTHEQAIVLAERLLKILPGDQKKIFFSDNGSTAVEVAIKMALQYWYNRGEERKKIIAIEGAFHGDTFGAMSVGERGSFTKPFQSLLFDVDFIPFPSQEKETEALNYFEKVAKEKDVAAFIYEPLIQGAAGMRMYSPEILDKLLNIAVSNNIICIADEVMTGFGRTGKLFASDYVNSKPDIICLSKGITGGTMALGATSCSEKIVKAFETSDKKKTFFHGHSYTANPLACAAANASMDLLMKESCMGNIAMISGKHKRFKDEISTFNKVKKVSHIGTILSIEIESEDGGYFDQMRDFLYKSFLEKDVLIRPLGNVIYILPPFITTEEELNYIYSIVKQVLRKI
jgi:adenosylmethionine---8-amino-7-oxononanoate aminotransferase